jgi:hypothetical protein
VPIFKEILSLKSGIMPICMVPFFGYCQLLAENGKFKYLRK